MLGPVLVPPGTVLKLEVMPTAASPPPVFLRATLDDRGANPRTVAQWSQSQLAAGVTFVALQTAGYDVFIFCTVAAAAGGPAQLDVSLTSNGVPLLLPNPLTVPFGGPASFFQELKVFVSHVS